ncbi:hypothetical protein HYALB_00007893 [Hymenoscyphus albidus]|uniref:Uncharacterized protein n=1 Tax=Hymenoscyphus albidus TaxID=595503 RepID=A0A9N9Q5A8_9HELO|nr:hypothetical protein HYALB_00007893 [Hymenoscyphus albidus]
MLDPAVQESQIVQPDYDPPVQAADFGSDDTVMSDDNDQQGIEVDESVRRIDAQPASVVEETQFVNLEIDTQAPEKIAFNRSASAFTSIVRDAQAFLPVNEPHFTRLPEPDLDDINVGFRFGQPSKPVPGQYTHNPKQRKPSAASAASHEKDDKLSGQASAAKLGQPAPFYTTAGSIEAAPSNPDMTSAASIKLVNATVKTSVVSQYSKSSHTSSSASGRASTVLGSNGTKSVSGQPPSAKAGSGTSENMSVTSHVRKPTIQSHHQADSSSKSPITPSRTKFPQHALDSPALQQTTAVPTPKTAPEVTVEEPVPKSLPRPAAPWPQMADNPAIGPQQAALRGAVQLEVPLNGQPAPRSAGKPPTRRKSLVRETNFKAPPPHRTSRSIARPFPEVQAESNHFKQPAKPKSKAATDATNHGSHHFPDQVRVSHPLENHTAFDGIQAGLEEPRNIEARPRAPRFPPQDVVLPPPVVRAEAPSPVGSMISQRSNMSVRITKAPSTSLAETTSKSQALRARHNSKVSKPLATSSSSAKLQSTKVTGSSPKINDTHVPLEVDQAADGNSQEPANPPVASTSDQTPTARTAPPKPKNVRKLSSSLEWRLSLGRVYEEKIAALESDLESKDEQLQSIHKQLMEQNSSVHRDLQSTKEENDLLRKAKEVLEAKRHETKEKVERWERRMSAYKEHMNDVVKLQNFLKSQAEVIQAKEQEKNRESINRIAQVLEEIKAAKAELNSAAEAEKVTAKARNDLEGVQNNLKKVKADKAAVDQTVKSYKAAINKYLLDLQEEKSKVEKLQKQLKGEKEAHAKLISTLEDLPQKVTAEFRKDNGPLADLLSTQVSLQNKIDAALEVLGELKTQEIKPSSSLVKHIEELFAQIPQPSTPPPDEKASTEQVISKLFGELKTSLDSFVSDSQAQVNLTAQITELQQNNSTLSATVTSSNQQKNKLAGQLEETQRHVDEYRNQLDFKTQELEALQALPKEDPRLVAKIEELEDENLGLRGQLQESTRLREENLTLHKKVGDYENQCSRHEGEKQEIRDSFIAEKKKDNEIAEKVRKESTFQSDRKIKSLKQTLQEVESELNQLKPKSTTQLENIKKLTEEVERYRKAQDSSKAEAQKHTDELTSEIETLQNQVSDLKAELAKWLKPSQVAAEKEVLLKQISELKAELKDKASRLDIMGSPRDMLRKNSQKDFSRREIPESQGYRDIEVSQLHQEKLKGPSLPTKRIPFGRWDRTTGDGFDFREPVVIPDSQSQEAAEGRLQNTSTEDHGFSQGRSSQPMQRTPPKSLSATGSGRSSAMSELTDIDEFMPVPTSDDDYDQLGKVYEKARVRKSSRDFLDPDEDLEKIRAQNILDRAKRRSSQPNHRATSSAQLKSALKASSTGSQDSTDSGAQKGIGVTADQPVRRKPPPALRGNPYNRVVSGSTPIKPYLVPETSPIHNGGVSRRNGTGLGQKRKSGSELVSPKASKASMTGNSSNDRLKMPPPPIRRPSTRSASIPPPESKFPPSRLSLPHPTVALKPKALSKRR